MKVHLLLPTLLYLSTVSHGRTTTEFTPTYDWQRVELSKESLPKGLEIRASLEPGNSNNTTTTPPSQGVYARIPPQWTFQTFVGQRASKPKVRAGFARVPVTQSTLLWNVALAIGDRTHSEPEQISFVLNQSQCLSTRALGYNSTLAASALHTYQRMLDDRLRWVHTEVQTIHLFQLKHCVSIEFNDTQPKHADELFSFIQNDIECIESLRCHHRHVRLEHCKEPYSDTNEESGYEKEYASRYCLWPWMLQNACHRKCNLHDERHYYGPLPRGNVPSAPTLVDNRYQVVGNEVGNGRNYDDQWVFDRQTWDYTLPTHGVDVRTFPHTIPHSTRIFHCKHCYMKNGALQLLQKTLIPQMDSIMSQAPAESIDSVKSFEWSSIVDSLGKPLAWPRHVSYYSIHPASLLMLHPTTLHKLFKHMNITDKKKMKDIKDEKAKRQKDVLQEQDYDAEHPEHQPNVSYTRGARDDPYSFLPYRCTRRFVHPVVHVSVWNVLNIFHVVWDLFIPLLEFFKLHHIQAPSPVHLFLHAGHPWMISRLARILNGQYNPGNQSPLTYLLTQIVSGVPIHSTTWLEHLPGTSCFDAFQAGLPMADSSPIGHGMYMAHEGYEIWSTLSNNRKDMYKSGNLNDELKLLSKKKLIELNTLVGVVVKNKYGDHLRGRETYANFVRSFMKMAGIVPVAARRDNPYQGQHIVLFVKREGTRVLLNRPRLVEIAQDRIAVLSGVRGGEGSPSFVVKGSIRLEHMTFAQQLLLFRATAILVAVHGQGCTNTMFMKGNGESALVLAMPPKFFGWHYLYANAAVALGVHTIVLMRPEDSPIGGWQGGVDNDRFNSKRDEHFNVREDMFEDGLEIALAKVMNGMREAGRDQGGDGSGVKVRGTGDAGGEMKDMVRQHNVEVDVEYVRGEEVLEFY